MNIYGIGSDIVEIKRIKRLYDQYSEKILQRILSENEIDQFLKSTTPMHYFAKRFAAKEAISKALGTGIGRYMAFKEISVLNQDSGKPRVVFSGMAMQTVFHLGIREVHISLSDENDYAIAFSIAVK